MYRANSSLRGYSTDIHVYEYQIYLNKTSNPHLVQMYKAHAYITRLDFIIYVKWNQLEFNSFAANFKIVVGDYVDIPYYNILAFR